MAIVSGVWRSHPSLNYILSAFRYIVFAFCAAVFARVVYEASLERVYAWGDLVKAAFDCFLPELAIKLGYKLPVKGAEQKKFWVAVSRRSIFHKPFAPEDWPPADDPKPCDSGRNVQSNSKEREQKASEKETETGEGDEKKVEGETEEAPNVGRTSVRLAARLCGDERRPTQPARRPAHRPAAPSPATARGTPR